MLGLFTHGKVALISDIHANLEALEAVLAHIRAQGDVERIYCLGDVVGYGPNPKKCLDLIIEKTKWCVLGNHDYAVFYEPTNLNYAAEQASFWTRHILETEKLKPQRGKRWNFLGQLPMKKTMEAKTISESAKIDFVHASPRKPINEYIFPDDVYTNTIKIKVLFARVEHICFVGHTHLPGVFLDEPDFYLPEELGHVYPIVDGEKAIINIGSVGQPRDRDNRASYVYVEGNEVNFVRLKYDYETTAKKILATKELDPFHAERLRDGR